MQLRTGRLFAAFNLKNTLEVRVEPLYFAAVCQPFSLCAAGATLFGHEWSRRLARADRTHKSKLEPHRGRYQSELYRTDRQSAYALKRDSEAFGEIRKLYEHSGPA